ncbi:hypothetical protein PPERSA_04609 [Pseudocohnilembus persalinus]|uniref:Uncharacterized protein n=1 Tax=Pseudocohnilembus persalinus TaxID=266149 RepID=A0A0V0QNI8_PSEPJ|nr:hypothetical protein PPERSA_04609 [Pseudocohnilembus persalinus]|eukprot:KRX03814.1 hypothetical protein PPERSA_04609 [Pseudocohnilembus persalinus]
MFRLNPFSDPFFDYHSRPLRMYDNFFDDFFDDSRFYHPYHIEQEKKHSEVEKMDEEYEKELKEYEENKRKLQQQEERLREQYYKQQELAFQKRQEELKREREELLKQQKEHPQQEKKGDQKNQVEYYTKSESMRSYINDKGERVVITKFAENKNGEKCKKIHEKVYDKQDQLISDRTFNNEKEIEDYHKKAIKH